MRLGYVLFAAIAVAALIGFVAGGSQPDSAQLAAEDPAPRAAQPAETMALPPGHPEVGRSAPPPSTAPVREIEPAKGDNAKRVAEIHAQRDALAKQRVRVRGVVVKTIGGIKGFSYSHLQDGSGSAGSGDNDLTVTTRFALERGSVVTLEGTLERDVDLGAGYHYDVLLSDAELIRD